MQFQLAKMNRRIVSISQSLVCLFFLPLGIANCQIVQLPTTGTFSLDTSVLVPDSGSAFLGGDRANAMSSRSLGPGSTAYGASRTAGGATAHATIIDLNELDEMIRSQASNKPVSPKLAPGKPKASQYPSGHKGKPVQNPEYEYLAAISHPELSSPRQISSDTNYYLALASNAKRSRHWASVELYYKLAWDSLPESRKKSVLKSLEEARNAEDTKESKDASK